MDLSTYTLPQLAAAFNAMTGSKIKKFENRQKAEARVAAALEERGLNDNAVLTLVSGQPAERSPEQEFTEDQVPAFLKKNRIAEVSAVLPEPTSAQDAPIERALEKFVGADERGDEWMRDLFREVFEAGRASAQRRRTEPKERVRREGPSKREMAAGLLLRPEGATAKDILDLTGWPSVSVQQVARASGLRLRQEKEGRATRYFGSEE